MNKFWIAPLLLMSMPVQAVPPYAATPAEQAMCQARVYSRLGERNENTKSMHHYCDGLRFLDRAYALMGNKRQMGYNLNIAIDNLNYVLNATQKNYAMRGEVHVAKARALKLMGRKAEAVAELGKALEYEFDSPDVYQTLADHFHETGNKQKALEMATEGLKRNPDSKGLKRRYTEFGGKLPYPEAVEKSKPVEASKEETTPVVKPEAAPAAGGAPSQATAPTEPAPQIEPPKIGSPNNPYCRFCPD